MNWHAAYISSKGDFGDKLDIIHGTYFSNINMADKYTFDVSIRHHLLAKLHEHAIDSIYLMIHGYTNKMVFDYVCGDRFHQYRYKVNPLMWNNFYLCLVHKRLSATSELGR